MCDVVKFMQYVLESAHIEFVLHFEHYHFSGFVQFINYCMVTQYKKPAAGYSKSVAM